MISKKCLSIMPEKPIDCLAALTVNSASMDLILGSINMLCNSTAVACNPLYIGGIIKSETICIMSLKTIIAVISIVPIDNSVTLYIDYINNGDNMFYNVFYFIALNSIQMYMEEDIEIYYQEETAEVVYDNTNDIVNEIKYDRKRVPLVCTNTIKIFSDSKDRDRIIYKMSSIDGASYRRMIDAISI